MILLYQSNFTNHSRMNLSDLPWRLREHLKNLALCAFVLFFFCLFVFENCREVKHLHKAHSIYLDILIISMGRCTDLIYNVPIWSHKTHWRVTRCFGDGLLLFCIFFLFVFNCGDLLSVIHAKADKSYLVSCRCFITSEHSEWWNLQCACSHSGLWYESKVEKVCRGKIFIKTEFGFYTL